MAGEVSLRSASSTIVERAAPAGSVSIHSATRCSAPENSGSPAFTRASRRIVRGSVARGERAAGATEDPLPGALAMATFQESFLSVVGKTSYQRARLSREWRAKFLGIGCRPRSGPVQNRANDRGVGRPDPATVHMGGAARPTRSVRGSEHAGACGWRFRLRRRPGAARAHASGTPIRVLDLRPPSADAEYVMGSATDYAGLSACGRGHGRGRSLRDGQRASGRRRRARPTRST